MIEMKSLKVVFNRTVHIRNLGRIIAVLSCHRCVINTGVEKMNYI
jgi:hypothetical protein